MREFSRMCVALGEIASTAGRTARLADYLRSCDAATAALATWLLLGNRPRRAVTSGELRTWAAERAGIPEWLLTASRDAVGDTAEAISLVLPEPGSAAACPTLEAFWRRFVAELGAVPAAERRRRVEEAWDLLDADGRFVFHKLLGGGFRIGVSRGLVLRAVAAARGISVAAATDRLHGAWRPSAEAWERLADAGETDAGTRPFPFQLAADLGDPAAAGAIAAWQVEWKFDGLRGQVVRRGGEVAIWSRGDERLDAAFPELVGLARSLPDGTVLDGEISMWEGEKLLPFAEVQRRIGRVKVEVGLFETVAARFIAYDLLERGGVDVRASPTAERRVLLGELFASHPHESLRISEVLAPRDWPDAAALRASSRTRGVEGLMLKRRDAPYSAGRAGNAWLKWKVDPFTVDLAVVAARPGSGRRAGLLSDWFLAARGDDGSLVTVASAYSGLDDAELRELDRILRESTVERKGPVRIVEPSVVLEIGFEGIAESPRHKAGVALRFPRVLRWRRDKAPDSIDTLASLRKLLG
jgi:DNA ligase-1